METINCSTQERLNDGFEEVGLIHNKNMDKETNILKMKDIV